ncbi:MAG: type II secretion system F family protein [Chloroflexi bacterium]|nr:type II secretion system F family protein [Chloroflexota bacterium]
MALILGLLMGLGLAAAWLALTADAAAPAPRPAARLAGEPALARLGGWLRRAGVALTPGGFLLRCGLGGAVAGLVLLALTGSPILALGAVAVGLALLASALDARGAAAERRTLLDLEVAVGQLRALIAAGAGPAAAVDELARHGPDRLRPAFARAARAAGLAGGGLAAGLERLRAEVGPAADDLVEALAIAHRAGAGALPAVLDQLADALHGRRRVEAAIATAQHRMTLQGRALAVAPLAMLLLLRWLAPEYAAVYDTPAGAAWLALIAGLVAAGYLLMRRLGRVAPPPRLRPATPDGAREGEDDG